MRSARTMNQRHHLVFGLLWVALAGCEVRGSVRVGGACTIDQTCLSGVCLRESQNQDGRAWIGGYCSGDCSDGKGCPQGICQDLADGRSYCVSPCDDNSQCRDGYVCSPDAKACLPDCRLGWSCGSSLTCDDNGACAAPQVTPQPLGSPCTLNAGCQGGLCIPEASSNGSTSWTAGTCTHDCTTNTSDCPSGSTCFPFQDGNARCLAACSASAPCRQGYQCSSEAKVCLPDCRLGWSCGNLVCDSLTGECAAAPTTDAGVKTDTRPAGADAAMPADSGKDVFSSGAGGGGMGPGGPGGRT